MQGPAARPDPREVCVWYADATPLVADRAARDRLVPILQAPEHARYEGYHADVDRSMFLLGRAMARTLVGEALGLEPGAWGWREGPHGRPEIAAPDTSVAFNIAHSSGLVVCALADGREVGVDVEDLERGPIDPRLVRRCCSPAEVADVEAQPSDRQRERFLTYWTLKEAYLKARGLGISVHLADISFSLDGNAARVDFLRSLAGTDTRWAFQLHQPTPRHLIAVAVATADAIVPAIRVQEMTSGVVLRKT